MGSPKPPPPRLRGQTSASTTPLLRRARNTRYGSDVLATLHHRTLPTVEKCFRHQHSCHETLNGPAQVKMSIACKNLAVSQTVGHQPPDPFAALYVADSRGHWERVSRTETAQKTRG